MDLFRRTITEAEQRELDTLRSQINIARGTLRHRLDNNLSQGELAKLAGTTQARVSEIEAMKGDPRLSTLARVALALGCVIDIVPLPSAVTASAPPGFRAVVSLDTQATATGHRWTTTELSKIPVTLQARHG